MNRQSMAVQAELAKAAENFIKEIKRLRNEHGFGKLSVAIDEDSEGATLEMKVHLHIDLNFTPSGQLEDEWRQEKLMPVETAVGSEP